MSTPAGSVASAFACFFAAAFCAFKAITAKFLNLSSARGGCC